MRRWFTVKEVDFSNVNIPKPCAMSMSMSRHLRKERKFLFPF